MVVCPFLEKGKKSSLRSSIVPAQQACTYLPFPLLGATYPMHCSSQLLILCAHLYTLMEDGKGFMCDQDENKNQCVMCEKQLKVIRDLWIYESAIFNSR